MRIQIIIFLIIASCFSAIGQTPLSLTDAITKALENNYDITIAKGNQQVAEISNNCVAVS